MKLNNADKYFQFRKTEIFNIKSENNDQKLFYDKQKERHVIKNCSSIIQLGTETITKSGKETTDSDESTLSKYDSECVENEVLVKPKTVSKIFDNQSLFLQLLGTETLTEVKKEVTDKDDDMQ